MPEGGFDTKRFKSELAWKYFIVSTRERLRMWREKRVVKRTVSNLFEKVKTMDSKIADLRLKLKFDLDFQITGFRKWKTAVKVFGEGEK